MRSNFFIFVTDSKFTERDYDRFGLKFFYKKEYKIKVLIVTKYTIPRIVHNDLGHYYPENIDLHICETLDSIKNTIANSEMGDICLLNISLDTIKGMLILKSLKSKNILTVKLYGGLIPVWKHNIEFNNTNKFINYLGKLLGIAARNKNVLNFMIKIREKVKFYFIRKSNIDILITSNYKTFLENFKRPKADHIIEIHNLDYDNYKKLKDPKVGKSEKYAVFIDQNLMFHEDFIRVGAVHKFDIEYYFSELNKVFTLIEKKYDIKVLIAGHPKVDIDDYNKYYLGRKVFFNKTAELIYSSSFVLMHYSTSLNYAILCEKQIYFLTNSMLKNNFSIGNRIEQFASITNQKLIYTDKLYQDIPELKIIDKNKYQNYKNKYIKIDTTKDSYSWDIFYEYLEKLNGR